MYRCKFVFLIALYATASLLTGCSRTKATPGQVELALVAGPSTRAAGPVAMDVLSIEAQIDGTWRTLASNPVEIELGSSGAPTRLPSVSLPEGHLTGMRMTISAEASARSSTKVAKKGKHTVTVTASCDHHVPPCASGTLVLEIDEIIAILEQLGVANPILQLIEAELAANECKPDMAQAQPDLAQTQPDLAQSQPDMTQAQPDLAQSQPDMTQAQPDGAIPPPADLSGFDAADPLCTNVICAPGETCHAGHCEPSTSCVNVICAPGETCVSGACVPATDMASSAQPAATVNPGSPADMATHCVHGGGDGHGDHHGHGHH